MKHHHFLTFEKQNCFKTIPPYELSPVEKHLISLLHLALSTNLMVTIGGKTTPWQSPSLEALFCLISGRAEFTFGIHEIDFVQALVR